MDHLQVCCTRPAGFRSQSDAGNLDPAYETKDWFRHCYQGTNRSGKDKQCHTQFTTVKIRDKLTPRIATGAVSDAVSLQIARDCVVLILKQLVSPARQIPTCVHLMSVAYLKEAADVMEHVCSGFQIILLIGVHLHAAFTARMRFKLKESPSFGMGYCMARFLSVMLAAMQKERLFSKLARAVRIAATCVVAAETCSLVDVTEFAKGVKKCCGASGVHDDMHLAQADINASMIALGRDRGHAYVSSAMQLRHAVMGMTRDEAMAGLPAVVGGLHEPPAVLPSQVAPVSNVSCPAAGAPVVSVTASPTVVPSVAGSAPTGAQVGPALCVSVEAIPRVSPAATDAVATPRAAHAIQPAMGPCTIIQAGGGAGMAPGRLLSGSCLDIRGGSGQAHSPGNGGTSERTGGPPRAPGEGNDEGMGQGCVVVKEEVDVTSKNFQQLAPEVQKLHGEVCLW